MPRELWAKIAVEITRDPKLLLREPWERWLWVGLICLTKENANGDATLHGYTPNVLSSVLNLRVSAAKVKAALEAFAALGMVRLHGDDDAIELIHFKKRQETGLNGTREQAKERKARWKERHGNDTGTTPERPENVIEEEEEEEEEILAAADLARSGAAAAADSPPGIKDLAAFLTAAWPGFPDPDGTVAAWAAAFPKLDLLAQVKAARAKEIASGDPIKQPGSYLQRWFETAIANPVTRRVNGSGKGLQEGTPEWDAAKRAGDEKAKREIQRTRALLAKREPVHREGHE